MIKASAIDRLNSQVAGLPAPVLSLYLDVNPANVENSRKAYLIRAKDALHQAGVQKNMIEKILTRLKLGEGVPRGMTLVVFAAGKGDEHLITHYFQVEFPIIQAMQGVIAHWGSPYITPLLMALDEHAPYAAIYLDQERWRYFEVYLGEIEELRDAFCEVDTESWKNLSAGAFASAGNPARSGSGRERYRRRMDSRTRHFYQDAAGMLEETLRGREVRRLFLIGCSEHLQDFEEALSTPLRSKVAAHLPPPPSPGASASEILKRVEGAIEQVEREEEDNILDEIRENGLWGFERIMEALQAGRLHLLSVPRKPAELGRIVYRCLENGHISISDRKASRLCPDGRFEEVRLGEVLPELAASHKTRVEFMRGEPERRLLRDFGGYAGLKRW